VAAAGKTAAILEERREGGKLAAPAPTSLADAGAARERPAEVLCLGLPEVRPNGSLEQLVSRV
jgi:hypothetical protein